MGLIVLSVLAALVAAFVRARADEGSAVRRKVRDAWRAFAAAQGLRLEDDRGHLRLHGRVHEVPFVLTRTQVRFGEWVYCASAAASLDVRAAVVFHHAFTFPSTAAAPLPKARTGDPSFDRRFEARLDPERAIGAVLTPEVRAALVTLPVPELTILAGRVAVVWSIEGDVPSEDELAAVRAILEAIAAPPRPGAYR